MMPLLRPAVLPTAAAFIVLLAALVLAPLPGWASSELFAQASQAYRDGDYQAAVDGVNAAFRAGEVGQQLAPTALVIRATAHAHLGDGDAAWRDIDNAIETSSTVALVAHGAAETARILGQPDRGLAYANIALRYSPGTPAYHDSRAALLRALGFEDLARRDDERARVLRDRDTAWSEEEDARRSCVQGNDQACLRALIPLLPDRASPGTAAMLGYLAIDLGESDWGRAVIAQMRDAEPEAPETWLYTGLLAYRDGDNATARADFHEALLRDPLDLRAGLGLIAASPGERFAALADWQAVVAGLPHDVSHDAIFALSQAGDWQAAADRAKELFASYDGPFAAVAVTLLSDGHLAPDLRKQLIGPVATFQRYGHDAFSRHLAAIERSRLDDG